MSDEKRIASLEDIDALTGLLAERDAEIELLLGALLDANSEAARLRDAGNRLADAVMGHDDVAKLQAAIDWRAVSGEKEDA